jgi:hypothetical protein
MFFLTVRRELLLAGFYLFTFAFPASLAGDPDEVI